MKLNDIKSKHIKEYRNEILKTSSVSTFDRKIFSLKKFFEWAAKEGYIDESPVSEFLKEEENTIENKLGRIEKQNKSVPPSYHSFQSRIIAKLAGKPKLQKVVYNLFYTRPNWYKSYHSLPIASYFNYAILVILMSALGFGVYNQFFKATVNTEAYPTSLTRAGRYLSFQGRLTNNFGNPITSATNLNFKLYDASQSGTLLWDSNTCSITPDTDGIFSTLLGSTCGNEIGSNVFTENAAVWLGVTVGNDAEATPRVQIATVAYALNSETLQGYPASSSATANTVPVLNSSGQLVLAASSPKIQSISGTFAIEGQATTISTADTSNGSITINPDGTGTLNLNFEGAAPGGGAGGFINATNANLNSGSLYYGSVANDSTGYNLLELKSGATPADKFVVNYAGNVTAAGTINGLTISSGTISGATWNGTAIGSQYGGTGANNSTAAQYSIPYYSATGVLGGILAPGSSGYVLTTNSTGGAPTWTPTSGVGTNYWQLANHVLAPANASDYDLVVGGNATGSGTFQVYAANGNIISTGNLNIGGRTTFGGITYTWPTSIPSNNYVLQAQTDGTLAWAAQTTGGTWTIGNAGVIYPNSQTVDVLIGATATASAKFAFTGVDGGTPTASISGTTNFVKTYLTGNGTLGTTNMSNLTLGSASTGNVIINSRGSTALTANGANLTAAGILYLANGTTYYIDASGNASLNGITGAGNLDINGTTNDIAGTLNLSGNALTSSADLTITPTGGQVILPTSVTLNVGGLSNVAYNAFAGVSDTPSAAAITTSNDLFVGGDTEMKGGLYLTGKNIYNVVGGVSTASIILATDPTAIDSYNALGYGGWLINNTVNPGIAALMVNESKNADIFTASSSGVAKFTIHNDGSFTLAGTTTAPTNNTAAGTIYFDTDTVTGSGTTGELYLRGEDSAWHRIALDMTTFSANDTALANGSAITITHNQNTNDLTATGWIYDTVTSIWKNISTYTHSIIQNLQNQFDLAGNSKNRTLSQATGVGLSPSVDTGTGADGAITITADTNINTANKISGRTCADGGDAVNYSVSSLTSTSATLGSTPSAGCLSAGDEVLLINLQGSNGYTTNTGNYETLRISSISTNVVNFTTSKQKYYGNGATDDTNLGTGATNQKVMLQRVPNYTTVTVNSGYNFYPSAYNYATGKGGVLFFRATGTVTVSGTIHANAMGYAGGAGATGYNANSYAGQGLFYTATATDGAGGTYVTAGYAGTFSGGGGGGKTGNTAGASGGAGSSIAGASGGGGGGSVYRYDSSNGGNGGGGGGGGNQEPGIGGNGGTGGISGGTGSEASSGAGQTAGTESSNNSGGGGGGGMSSVGSTTLTKLTMGGGGGGGGGGANSSGTNYAGRAGGTGGGIVAISANTISVSGTVKSTGADGISNTSGNGGAGGAGAGGSIKLQANSLSLGTNLVSAAGGTGGTDSSSAANNGGNGGTGYVAIYYTNSYTGSISTPTPSYTQQPYYPYGTYNSSPIATTNAASLDKIRWEATPSAYGKIEFQTRTGNSADPTDGSWESWMPSANTTTCASPNCLALESEAANYYTNWTGTNATVAVGDVTRDVNQYEDDDQATATNLTKITSSTNGGYVEAAVSSNLSNYDYLTLWIRASQTGNSVKIGIGESAATEQEETITIDTANTWQKVYWDLSDIPANSRDAITKLRLTNLTGSSNTIYLGYVHGEKLLATSSGSTISSTPNNYIQYRAIITTTNTSYQPSFYNVNIDYNDGFKITQASDKNSVSLYNLTGSTQNVRLDVTTFGADLAEYYTVDDTSIGSGDVVALTGQMDDSGVPILRKANAKSDSNVIGIISTNAGQKLGIAAENRRLLALAGRVPVKIDPSSPAISAGDGITSSNLMGYATKASFGDLVIAKAAQAWKPGDGDTIFVIVTSSGSTNSYLSSISDYQLLNDAFTNSWTLASSVTGEVAKNVAAFSSMIAANIKAGMVITGDFISNNANIAVAAIQDLAAPKLATKIISPIPGETNVIVQIGSEATPSGKFIVQDASGSAVASIDNLGNATFSGTLYADDIQSKSLDEIKKLLTDVEADQSVLSQITNWTILMSTNAANLNELATANLYVTGQAAMNSLSITSSFAVGSDFILNSDSSLNTLSAPLKLQSLAMAPIEMMAGLFKIDTTGNVQILGNLNVAGRIYSSGLTLQGEPFKGDEATGSASLLTLQNVNGNTVSTVDASGSAMFNSISTNGLTIAGAIDATNSAIVNGVISTNATAGSGVIPAGATEITIKNNNVTAYTLVYITPTSSTKNNVLYVKSKKNGEFVIGFANPVDVDVNFNWWIVKVSQ